jgi:hypothetical protein
MNPCARPATRRGARRQPQRTAAATTASAPGRGSTLGTVTAALQVGRSAAVPDQAIEHRSTDHRAVITGAQLSVISAKPSTATAAQTSNPHSRPGAHRLPAGSFFGGFRTPALGSAARFNDRPASETLPVTSRSAQSSKSVGF